MPDDVGRAPGGDGVAEVADGDVPAVGGEEAVEFGPPFLPGKAAQGDEGSGDEGGKGALCGAAAPVESQGDDGAGAGPEGSGDGEEHEDEVDLGEGAAEEVGEGGDAGDGEAQGSQLLRGGEGAAAEGEDEVLDEDAAPGVQVGGVGGDEQEDHEGTEDAYEAAG